MIRENEYVKLLGALVQVVESNKGFKVKNGEWAIDAEGLALKFFSHAASVLYLYRSTTIKDLEVGPISFFDISSVNVLSRSAFETFLIFHKVFIAPNNQEEKQFYYKLWVISGLRERQEFAKNASDPKGQLATEMEQIQSLQQEIEQSPAFNMLTENQKAQQQRRGKWRFNSWKELAIEAGFSEQNANSIYSYLSEYAHSGNIGIRQITQAKDKETQKQLCSVALHLIMICTAKLILFYCSLFPKSADYLKSQTETKKIIQIWESLAS
ncbi:hypothetical protein KKA14_16600 [bacterium]|nr:hypothetical protein [bacterium]